MILSMARPKDRRPLPAWRLWTRLSMTLALALLVITETGAALDDASAPAPAPTAVAGPAQIDNLAVITIEGEITAVTQKSFERRLQAALDAGADGIVVELNTPGGAVGAVIEINKLIEQTSVPVIAWINTDAYSGGAIIAIACDEIVIASGATMGDAAPVLASPMGLQSLGDTERAKILSPLIAEVVDSAQRNGYDEVLVTSLVMIGVETWLVERKDTGERYFLTEREYRALFNEDPPRATPIVTSGGVAPGALAPPPSNSSGQSLPQGAIPGIPSDGQGQGGQATPPPQDLPDDAPPTLRALADVADESTVAAASVGIGSTSNRPDFAQEDPDDYRFIQYATDGNTLLTLKENGLRALGFVSYPQTIDNDQDLKNYVAAKNLERLDQSWSEDFVEFATQGASGLLFRGAMIVIFLLGLFIEMAMPGVGIAGLIALLALGGLVIPPLLIDASGWWTVVAILAGIGLIVVELFVIPGLGIPGITGFLLLLVGLVGTFSSAGELFPGTGEGSDGRLGWAIATVFLAVFGAGVGAYFVSKYTRSIPIARNLMLSSTMSTYDTGAKVGMLAAMDAAPTSALNVGDVGRTTTSLRPEGEAEFDGELHDVSCATGFVDRATPVRVVEVTGNRVIVEPAPEEGTSGGATA